MYSNLSCHAPSNMCHHATVVLYLCKDDYLIFNDIHSNVKVSTFDEDSSNQFHKKCRNEICEIQICAYIVACPRIACYTVPIPLSLSFFFFNSSQNGVLEKRLKKKTISTLFHITTSTKSLMAVHQTFRQRAYQSTDLHQNYANL